MENGRIQRNNRIKIIAFWVITVILAIGICSSIVTNIAVNGRIDWSLIPATGCLLVWLTAAPLLLLKRNRAITSIAGFYIGTAITLFTIETVINVHGYLLGIGLPLLGLMFVLTEIVAILGVYTKTSKFYVSAIALIFIGIVDFCSDIMNYFIFGRSVMILETVLSAAVCGIIAVVCIAIGLSSRKASNMKLQ